MICFIQPVSGLGGTRNSQVSGFRILRYSYCRWEMCSSCPESPLSLRDVESRRPLNQLLKTLQLASFGHNGAAALHQQSSFSFPVGVTPSVLQWKTIFSLFDSYSFGHYLKVIRPDCRVIGSLLAQLFLSCSFNPVVTPNPQCLQIICQTWWAFAFRCCRVFSFWSQSSSVKHWPSSMFESNSLLGLAKINTDTRVGAHF